MTGFFTTTFCCCWCLSFHFFFCPFFFFVWLGLREGQGEKEKLIINSSSWNCKYRSILASELSVCSASKGKPECSVEWDQGCSAQPSSGLTFLSFRFVAVSVFEIWLLCFSFSISCIYIRSSSGCIFSVNSISFSSAFLISNRTCISCSFSSLSAISNKY